MVAHDVPVAIVSGVVLLDRLMVLNMRLLVVLPLLVVEGHGHTLTSEGAIEAGRMALLVVLGEHASKIGGLEARERECRIESGFV